MTILIYILYDETAHNTLKVSIHKKKKNKDPFKVENADNLLLIY